MLSDNQTSVILVILGAVLSQSITWGVYFIRKRQQDKRWDAAAGVEKDEDFKI